MQFPLNCHAVRSKFLSYLPQTHSEFNIQTLIHLTSVAVNRLIEEDNLPPRSQVNKYSTLLTFSTSSENFVIIVTTLLPASHYHERG